MKKGKGFGKTRTKMKMYTLSHSQELETQWELKEPVSAMDLLSMSKLKCCRRKGGNVLKEKDLSLEVRGLTFYFCMWPSVNKSQIQFESWFPHIYCWFFYVHQWYNINQNILNSCCMPGTVVNALYALYLI